MLTEVTPSSSWALCHRLVLIFVLSLWSSSNDVTTPTTPGPDPSEALLRVYSGPPLPSWGEHRSTLMGLSIRNSKAGYSLYAAHHTVHKKVLNWTGLLHLLHYIINEYIIWLLSAVLIRGRFVEWQLPWASPWWIEAHHGHVAQVDSGHGLVHIMHKNMHRKILPCVEETCINAALPLWPYSHLGTEVFAPFPLQKKMSDNLACMFSSTLAGEAFLSFVSSPDELHFFNLKDLRLRAPSWSHKSYHKRDQLFSSSSWIFCLECQKLNLQSKVRFNNSVAWSCSPSAVLI